MNRIWQGGFENNSEKEFTTVSDSPEIQTTLIRTGIYAGRISALSSGTRKYWQVTFVSSNNDGPYFKRFYFRYPTLPNSNNTIFQFLSSGDVARAKIQLTSTGTLILSDDVGQIGSASSVLTSNTWYRIEVEFNRNPAAGSQIVRARIDGVEFAGSSSRTITTGINKFRIGGNLDSEAQTIGEWFFDDLALNTDVYCGDGGIIHRRPNAVGDASDWTNDYTAVDEVSPDDVTTFVASNTSGHIDDHNIEAAGVSGDINVVALGVRYRAANATNAAGFVLRIKASSGGTVEESSEIVPNSTTWRTNENSNTIQNFSLVLYNKPGASTDPYTFSDIDTTQIGYRISTGNTNNVQISTVYLSIDYSPPAPVTISPSGIDVSVGIGNLSLSYNQFVSPSGIDSTVNFGTAVLSSVILINPLGIDSNVNFGTPLIVIPQFIGITGIDVNVEFGIPFISIPTGYAEWVELSRRYNVILLELWPWKRLFNWTLNSGSTYYATFDKPTVVDYLRYGTNPLETLVSRSSITLVNNNAGSFFQDRTTNRIYTRLPDSSNPNIHLMRAYYLVGVANKVKRNRNRIISFDGNPYPAFISSGFKFTYKDILLDIFDSYKEQGGVSIDLLNYLDKNNLGYFDPILVEDCLNDVPANILHGDDGEDLEYTSFRRYHFKTKHEPKIKENLITLDLAPLSRIYNEVIPKESFTSTLYPKADPSIYGKRIPILRGFHKYIPCFCIDTTTGRYKVCSNSLTSILEVVTKSGKTDDDGNIIGEEISYTPDLSDGEFIVDLDERIPTLFGTDLTLTGGSYSVGNTRHFAVTAVDERDNESLPSDDVEITITGSNNGFVLECGEVVGAKKYKLYIGTSANSYVKWFEMGTNRRLTVPNAEEWTTGSPPTISNFSPILYATVERYSGSISKETLGVATKSILEEELDITFTAIFNASVEQFDKDFPYECKIYLDEEKQTVGQFLRRVEQSSLGNIYDKDNDLYMEILKPKNIPDVVLYQHDILNIEKTSDDIIPVKEVIVGFIENRRLGEEWYLNKRYSEVKISNDLIENYDNATQQTINTFLTNEHDAAILGNRLAFIGANIPKSFIIEGSGKLSQLRRGYFVQVYFNKGYLTSDLIFGGDILFVREVELDYSTNIPKIVVDDFFGIGRKVAYTMPEGSSDTWASFDEHTRTQNGFSTDSDGRANGSDYSSIEQGTLTW